MVLRRDELLEEVETYLQEQAKSSGDLLAAYLCGSFLEEGHTFGGAADIDLVCVHLGEVTTPRTIHPISETVHLDVAHHPHQAYRQPRQLRQDAWLGATLSACRVVYDPQHFMDFVIAVVRDRFWSAENIYARAKKMFSRGSELCQEACAAISAGAVPRVQAYLRAARHLAQAVACLNGAPLTDRRFLEQYRLRAAAVGRPGLYHGLLGLLGAPFVALEDVRTWQEQLDGAYLRLGESEDDPRLHMARRAYYLGGIAALLGGEAPQEALWPLLRLWSEVVRRLPPQDEGQQTWRQVCQQVQLHEEGFAERCQALEAYADAVQEALRDWARRNGVWGVA